VKKWLWLLVAYLVLNAAQVVFAAGPEKESRFIPYPAGYDIRAAGASAISGTSNVSHSPYYPVLDFYHMKSTATLTILPKYQTYQQTTEFTCGPAAALTVLYYAGNAHWDELKIAGIMETKQGTGTDTAGMVKFFKSIGWEVEASLNTARQDGTTFADIQAFKDFVITNLQHNTPIMVENIDWGGHWRVVIGYDNLGTETIADDVLILADPYDTADHFQDGYVVNPVVKFYYMWFDAHMLPEGHKTQQWLTAKPPAP